MPSTHASSPRRGVRSAVVALTVVSVLLVVTLVVAAAAGAVVVLSVLAAEPAGERSIALVLLAAVVPTEAVYLAVSITYAHVRELPVPVRVPTRRDAALVLAGSVVTVVAATVIFAVGDAAGVSPVSSAFDPATGADPSALLLLAPLSILVVAPAEEAFFRGVVQGRLRRTFGPAASVGVASALFAAVHVFNFVSFDRPVGLLVPLGAIFVVSLVLGGAYEVTDNLVVPVAVHGAYNATLAVVSYLSVVGAV
ncbi:CPBP family intramembrane glutamic endopeptidase [Halopelagius fulvigenes]|uniref:CPBP family intramembrane glutamic endopeptidase n=1 Tax=Halopelagius fulvigenes TaxID=1198324 RepID=A0ABD5U3R5_9EURY